MRRPETSASIASITPTPAPKVKPSSPEPLSKDALTGGAPLRTFGQLKQLCAEHPGRVPLFLHLLVDRQEVVIRARGLSVDASPEFVAAAETLLGAGAVTVEYAGRA